MNPENLLEHPEGGRFREVFKSQRIVTTPSGTARSALTHIYFSLNSGEVSKFHRVLSDEVWNLYQGNGLNLYIWEGANELPEVIRLSAEDNAFCHVVPAGVWQAAEPLDEAVLVGCSVAPGFEFSDFKLLHAEPEQAKVLNAMDPKMAKFIGR